MDEPRHATPDRPPVRANCPPVVIRPLRVDDEAQALAAHRELAAEGFTFLLELATEEATEPWPDYLARLDRQRRGIDLPQGWVPSTFLVAEVDGRIVGRVSVRHVLTERLRVWGGHVGYAVLPAHRRRGYATAMLDHALGVLAGLGVTEAVLTCDEANVASRRVIEGRGGRLGGLVADGATTGRRYLVPTVR